MSIANQGINDDQPTHVFDVPNLVDQLEASGHTWDAYMESLPSVGFSDSPGAKLNSPNA